MTKSESYNDSTEEITSTEPYTPPSNCPFCNAEIAKNWTWSVQYACNTIGYKTMAIKKFGKNCNGKGISK